MPHAVTTRLQWVTRPLVLCALVLAGCTSDSPTDPGEGGEQVSSPGVGSGTLQVMGSVEIQDTGDGQYETHFSVTVSDSEGAPVSGATVTFEAEFGRRTLPEDGASAGLYATSRAGHVPGAYALHVRAGADSLTGLTVWAPPIHAITQPAPGEVVVANEILRVRWSVPEVARECRLTTRDYDSSWINGDPQTLWVPRVGNPLREDQRIRVIRRNTQFSEEGLFGTRLSASVRRTLEPVIAR